MLKAVLLNDTAITDGNIRHLGCHATCAGLTQLLASRGVEIVDRISSPAVARQGMRLSERASAQPLLVVNGEGTMHDNASRARTIFELVMHARMKGCYTWVVNTEWYRMDPHAIGGSDLPEEIEYLAIRDSLSHGQAIADGINQHPRAVLSADCSWLLPPAPPVPCEDILLVASGLRIPDAATVDRVLKCFPRLRVERTSGFYPQPGGIVSTTVAEEFARFARASIVLSSTYHGCNFAAIHGTPFLWLQSCTPKIDTFAREVYGVDVHRNAPRLNAGIAVWSEWLPAAKRALTHAAAHMRARAALNVPETHPSFL